MITFYPQPCLSRRYNYTFLRDEETEIQRVQVIYPRSHSQLVREAKHKPSFFCFPRCSKVNVSLKRNDNIEHYHFIEYLQARSSVICHIQIFPIYVLNKPVKQALLSMQYSKSLSNFPIAAKLLRHGARVEDRPTFTTRALTTRGREEEDHWQPSAPEGFHVLDRHSLSTTCGQSEGTEMHVAQPPTSCTLPFCKLINGHELTFPDLYWSK